MGKEAKSGYKIEKKRSGRWMVIGPRGKTINGDAKAAILAKEGKIQGYKPKKTEPEPEAAASEEASES